MTDTFSWLAPALGGVLIGLAAGGLWLSSGRVAGISSIVGELVRADARAAGWRWLFVAGLLTGGLLLAWAYPAAFADELHGSLLHFGAAGLAVGIGARLGGGCTSGHGVCGLAHLSRRSLVATATFMASGALTVFVVQHLLGGGMQ